MNELLIALLLLGQVPTTHKTCGVERWPIKTLADADATRINPHVIDVTVEQLRAETAPNDLKTTGNKRHNPVEFTHYRVHALFLGYKHESDSDFHLVLASPTDKTKTIIAEIPAGACVPPKIRKQEANLQTWVVKRFGSPKQPGRMLRFAQPRLVVVEGIGFFDFLHGQTGVAPNGIEIHPVTSITLDSASMTSDGKLVQ